MREANELAAAATEHVAANIRVGHARKRRGRDVGGLRPRRGRRARRAATRWSGRAPASAPSRRPATVPSRRTSRRCSRSGSAWTATGATTPRTSCPGELTPRTTSCSTNCSRSTTPRSTTAGTAPASPELDRLVRDGIAEAGYPGQPSHPICHGVGARAHEPPTRTRRVGHDPGRHGAGDRAGDLLGGGRRFATRGQLPDHRRRAGEALPVSGRLPMTETLRREAARVAVIDMDRRAASAAHLGSGQVGERRLGAAGRRTEGWRDPRRRSAARALRRDGHPRRASSGPASASSRPTSSSTAVATASGRRSSRFGSSGKTARRLHSNPGLNAQPTSGTSGSRSTTCAAAGSVYTLGSCPTCSRGISRE